MIELAHKYQAKGAALRLFYERGAEVCLSGPAGTGKSRAALEKLNLAMLKYPSARGLIVRRTAVSLANSAFKTLKDAVLPEFIASGYVSWYGGSAREPAQYRYANGSLLTLAGMDKASRVMSSEYDIIYVQEATELEEEHWEALNTRLRNGVMPYQQLIADCNPDSPTHWLKQRANRGTVLMLESRHEDNPTLFDNEVPTKAGAAYLAKLDALTGVRRARLRDGLWVAAEGIIYEDFDPALHVLPQSFVIPNHWRRFWTVDFGFVHPFVLQRWAEDPDGALYMYEEIFHTRRTVDIHAKNVLERAKNEPRPEQIICDHDAEGRAVLERELQMSTVAANKAVRNGIEAMQRRLRLVNNKPRIFFREGACVERDPELVDSKRPASTVEEFSSYVWLDNGKEAPRKEGDDGMDASRYMVAYRDLQGEPRFRGWL